MTGGARARWLAILALLAGCTRDGLREVPPPPDVPDAAASDASEPPPPCVSDVGRPCWPAGVPVPPPGVGGALQGVCRWGARQCDGTCAGYQAPLGTDTCTEDRDCDGRIAPPLVPCWSSWNAADGGPLPVQAVTGDCRPGLLDCARGCVGQVLPSAAPVCGHDTSCTGVVYVPHPLEVRVAVEAPAGESDPSSYEGAAGLLRDWSSRHAEPVRFAVDVFAAPEQLDAGTLGTATQAADALDALGAAANSVESQDEPEEWGACATPDAGLVLLVSDDGAAPLPCSRNVVVVTAAASAAGWRVPVVLYDSGGTLDDVIGAAECGP